MKHTPGPWKRDGLFVYATHARRGAEINQFSASVQNDNHDCGEVELMANACLIASAPDLLEACKDLLLTNVHGVVKSCGHDYPCVCTEIRARKAIAKAEGQ